MKKIYLLLTLCCMYLQGFSTIYYNVANSATLQATTSWGTVEADGSGAHPANFTTSGDVFVLENGATGTIASAWTLGSGVTLNVGSGSAMVLTIPSSAGVSLTGGTVNVSAGATLNLANTTIPTLGTLDAGSTVIYATANQTVAAGSYGNLTTSLASGTVTAGGDINVASTLTTAAGGTLNMSTFKLTATTITNNGSIFTQNTSSTPIPSGMSIGGTVNYSKTTGGQTIVTGTYNNLTISGTSGVNTASGPLNIGATLTTTATDTLDMGTNAITAATTITNNGTILTQNTSATPIPGGKTIGGAVVYNAATGGQTIVAETSYATLILGNSSGTDTVNGNITANTALKTTAGGTLDMKSTYVLNGTMGTIINNGTIQSAVTSTAFTTGKTWGGTGKVIYNAPTGTQMVMAGTYNCRLQLATTGISSASGAITANDSLIVPANDTLDFGGSNLLGATIKPLLNGMLRTASSTNPPIPANAVWGGTVFFNRGAAQSIPAGTYNNLLTASATTVQGNLTVNGTLSISSGTMNMGAFKLSGTPTSITLNAQLTTSCTQNPPIPSGLNWSNGANGIIAFSGTGGRFFIPAGTYKSITLNNTSDTNFVTGTLSLTGTFTTTGAGGNLNLGTNVIAGVTTITNNGTGSILTQATNPFPSGKSIGGSVYFNGTSGGQTIPQGTYTRLKVVNTSGTNTAAGALSVATELNIASGATLDMGTNALSGGLTTITNNGIFKTSNTSAAPITTGKNWGAAGTVIYAADAGGQTLMAGTYNNLQLKNSSGTNTNTANVVYINTSFSDSTGIVDFTGTSSQLNGSGTATFTNYGTIRTACSSSPAIASGINWGGTVAFNRTNAQNLPAGTFNNLYIIPTATATTTALGDIVVNGTFSTSPTATLAMGSNAFTGTTTVIHNGALTTASTAALPIPSGANWTGTTGSVTYTATGGRQFIPAGTYKTLTCSANVTDTNTVLGDITITGTFATCGAGGTLYMGANTLSGSAATFTNSGTLVTAKSSSAPIPTGKNWGGTVVYGGTGAQTILAGTYNNIELAGTRSGAPTITLENGTINISGDFDVTATGVGGYSAGTSTVSYNTNANSTIAGITYNNLTINIPSNGNTKTAGGNVVVNGALTTTANGVFSMDVYQLTGSLTSVTNNGTISTACTMNPAIPNGIDWSGNSGTTRKVIYAATSGRQYVAGGTYYAILCNTSDTNSATGDINSTNTIQVSASTGALDMGTYALSIVGQTNTGTILTQNTSSTPLTSGKTWKGPVVYNGSGNQTIVWGTYLDTLTIGGARTGTPTITLDPAGTITATKDVLATYTGSVNFTTTGNQFRYNGTSSGAIAPITYGYLNFTHTSGTKVAGGDVVVRDSMRTSSGYVDFSVYTLSGTLTKIYNGSTILTSRTGSAAFASNVDWTLSGGVVQFSSDTGGQVIPAGTYSNLYSSNTSGTNTVSGTLTINGNFSMNVLGGGTVNMGTNVMTTGTSVTPLGLGTLQTSNSSSTPLPAGVSWTQKVEYNRAAGGQTIVMGNYNAGLTNSNTSGINFIPQDSTIVVRGNLTLNSGSVLSDSGGVVYLVGNIVGTGSHIGTGEIHMATDTTSPSVQTIDGASLTNLELDNTGGFALSGDPTISGTLTLTSGVLDIGANNLTLDINSPAIAGTPGASNMIATSSTGQVRKMMSSTGSYVFPVGDNTPNYSPITINVTSGTFGGGAYAGVRAAGVKHPSNANTDNYLSRYWHVSTSGITSPVYSVAATYVDGDVNGSEADIYQASYTGSIPWTTYDPVDAGANAISISGLSGANTDISGISTRLTVSVNPVSAVCPGGSTDFNADASADAPVSYTWAPSTGLSATTGNPVTVSPGMTPGVYTYTVTAHDGNGITATATVNVTVSALPTAGTITGPSAICVFSSTDFDATGDAGGAWQTADSLVALVDTAGFVRGLIGDSTALVYYIVTTACGADTASATVILHPLPDAGTLSFTNNHSACIGVNTTYIASLPGGVWATSNPSVATVDTTGIVTPVGAGVVTVSYTITDTNSCSRSKTTTLNVNDFPTVSAITYTSNEICPTVTTALVDTTVAGGTFTWSSSSTGIATVNSSGVVTGVSGGTATISYNFTVSKCTTSATTTVQVNPATVATVTGTAMVCVNGGTTTLSAMPTGGTWTSSNTTRATVDMTSGIVTGGSASGIANITYTYTNEFGCTSIKVTAVTVNSLPSVSSISGAGSVCTGSAITLNDATSGGVWVSSTTGVATIGSGSGIANGVTAGTTTISYTFTNITTGCSNTATKVLSVNMTPTVSAINASGGIVCTNSTITAIDSTSGGAWSSSNTAVGTVTSSTGIVTGKTAGTTTISYSYTSGGCTAVATSVFTVNPTTTPSVTGTASLCVGATTTYLGTPSGGVWSSSNSARGSIDASSGIAAGITAGAITITYSYTNEYSCIGKSLTAVVVNSLPSVSNISGATSVCQGSAATLVDGTSGGVWASGTPSIATIGTSGIASGVSAGTTVISYTVTNGTTGCSRTATKVFTVNGLPSVAAIGAGSGHVCPAATLALTESTTGTHTWISSTTSVATVNSSSGVVTGVAEGTTTITYSYTNVCNNIATTVITVNPSATGGTITGADNVTAGSTTPLSTDGTSGGTWTSSAPSTASVGSASGIVTGVAPGNATITYTVTSCGTAFSTHAISVLSPRPGAVLAANVTVKVFPNPTSGAFTLTAGSAGTFTVFTVDGKMLAQYDVTQAVSEYNLPHGTAAGVYMCKYEGVDGSTAIVRLVYNP